MVGDLAQDVNRDHPLPVAVVKKGLAIALSPEPVYAGHVPSPSCVDPVFVWVHGKDLDPRGRIAFVLGPAVDAGCVAAFILLFSVRERV